MSLLPPTDWIPELNEGAYVLAAAGAELVPHRKDTDGCVFFASPNEILSTKKKEMKEHKKNKRYIDGSRHVYYPHPWIEPWTFDRYNLAQPHGVSGRRVLTGRPLAHVCCGREMASCDAGQKSRAKTQSSSFITPNPGFYPSRRSKARLS
ncbi:hypothetical protein P167DRAFT_543462 [Morchella conica CCBAS932]|uniref:Uncharacterized protein n=1 Tax=Morchella conica CCBAS932 TaxID=1392247 RepID=A0A3N4KW35_9PEZI|nr:hypothetical protein P167DRAFT_543462 [Morchella conica CCBAS932]